MNERAGHRKPGKQQRQTDAQGGLQAQASNTRMGEEHANGGGTRESSSAFPFEHANGNAEEEEQEEQEETRQ